MASYEHSADFNCPICFELLSDPKELSCSHAFCDICLGHIYVCSSKISNYLACPICKTKTLVKDGNVRNLKTNESLKSRADSVSVSQQLCEMCDLKLNAIHFCSECTKNMCDTCLEDHNRWPLLLKHEVASVADIREGSAFLKKKVFCQEHKSRQEYVCSIVCITCKKPICMSCGIFYHNEKGCIIQEINEYNDSVKAKFQSLQDQAKAKTAIIKSHLTYIVNQKKNISDHIDGKKTAINKVSEESIKKLGVRKAVLVKQLEDQKVELHDEFDNMKDYDEKMIASIESASSLLGRSMKAPLGGSIIDIRDAVSGELQILLNKPDPEKKLGESKAAKQQEDQKVELHERLDEMKDYKQRWLHTQGEHATPPEAIEKHPETDYKQRWLHTQGEHATPPEAIEKHPETDRHHSEGIFDKLGGELTVVSHGLTLTIPPGSLKEDISQKITVDVLQEQDNPPDIPFRDEMIVTNTFQCLPSGLQFAADKPVRLTMPHCANLINPQKVQAVLYCWNHGTEEGQPQRLLQTSKTCRVTHRCVEIFLPHFSRGFLAFIIDWLYMWGKRMSFMPFLPRTMPPSRNAMLEFRMVDKPHGTSWRHVHKFNKDDNCQPSKDDDDEMNVSNKDLRVKCQLKGNIPVEENVKGDSLMNKSKHTVYFELDFNDKPNDLPVRLELKQADDEMYIRFMTRFMETLGTQGTGESSSPLQLQDRVDDQKLNKLSEQIPPDKYHVFCGMIGFEYNKANGILASNNNNHCRAVRQCLGVWKDRTCGSLQELKEILEKAELKALTKYIEDFE